MRMLRAAVVTAALVAGLTGPALAAAPAATPSAQATPAAPAAVDAAVVDAARAKVAAGDTRGAIAELAPYVATHPGDVAAGRLLGDLYFRVPDYANAERVWKALTALDPLDRETHSRLGSLYSAMDRITDAMTEFGQSLPDKDGYAGLVALHKRNGDLTQYLARLRSESELRPLDVARWNELGQALRATRHYDQALDAFSHVVTIRPSSCGARVDVANALVDLGRIDDAVKHLKACLALDANYYPAVVNMGEAYLEKNDSATARPFLDRALAIKPEGNEALVDIGYIYYKQADWKTAVAYYNRAIRADPLRPEPYINLGYAFNEHRLFPLAEAAYIKGLSVSQDDGRLHYMLAVTYNVQGKIALARDQYRYAIASEEPVVVRLARSELALLPSQ